MGPQWGIIVQQLTFENGQSQLPLERLGLFPKWHTAVLAAYNMYAFASRIVPSFTESIAKKVFCLMKLAHQENKHTTPQQRKKSTNPLGLYGKPCISMQNMPFRKQTQSDHRTKFCEKSVHSLIALAPSGETVDVSFVVP